MTMLVKDRKEKRIKQSRWRFVFFRQHYVQLLVQQPKKEKRNKVRRPVGRTLPNNHTAHVQLSSPIGRRVREFTNKPWQPFFFSFSPFQTPENSCQAPQCHSSSSDFRTLRSTARLRVNVIESHLIAPNPEYILLAFLTFPAFIYFVSLPLCLRHFFRPSFSHVSLLGSFFSRLSWTFPKTIKGTIFLDFIFLSISVIYTTSICLRLRIFGLIFLFQLSFWEFIWSYFAQRYRSCTARNIRVSKFLFRMVLEKNLVFIFHCMPVLVGSPGPCCVIFSLRIFCKIFGLSRRIRMNLF